MTNPRTLCLSIAATACGFILTLVGVVGPASIAPTPAVGAATAPGLVSAMAQDVSHFDPVAFVVAPEPAASGPAPALDAADRDDSSDPLHSRARWFHPHGSRR